MDLHPFIGNHETKAMAIDNILHMIRNYLSCSVCKMIVLVWLMDEPWVIRSITEGIAAMQAEAQVVTLICNKKNLISRWKNDLTCEWRTDEWLHVSLKSLPAFSAMENMLAAYWIVYSAKRELYIASKDVLIWLSSVRMPARVPFSFQV